MNNDIKENKIPNKLYIELNKYDENKINWYTANNLECDLAIKINELIDYITNLQEENTRLHTRIKTIKRRRKTQTAKLRKYREEITNKQNSIVDYKSRIDKAIEYLKDEACYSDGEFCDDLDYCYCKELLNILKGESDES